MPFELNCPGCDHLFKVPDSFADKRGKCPKCATVFRAVRPPKSSSNGAPVSVAPSPKIPVSPAGRTKSKSPGPAIPQPKKLKAMLPPEQPKEKPAGPAPPPQKKPAPTEAAPSKPLPPAAPVDLGSPADPLGRAPVTAPRKSLPQKPKSSLGPILLIAGMVLLLVVGAGAGAVGWNYWLQSNDQLAKGDKDSKSNEESNDNEKSAAETAKRETSRPHQPVGLDTKTRPEDAPLTANWDTIRQSIVRVDVLTTGGGSKEGGGFIVDSNKGWVATSQQLISDAEDVLIVSSNGLRWETTGIAGFQPESGVAILQVAGAGSLKGFPAIGLEASAKLSPRTLVFVGDTRVATPAGVTRMLDVADLSAQGRSSLYAELRQADIEWIEHSARLGLSGDGLPLLSKEGDVVGVNVKLASAEKGHAIPAEHLASLLRASYDGELTSFEDAVITPSTPEPTDVAGGPDPPEGVVDLGEPVFPTPGTPDPTFPEPMPRDGERSDIEDFRFRLKQCQDLDWLPKTAGDYASFQDLARLMHRAKSTIDAGEGAVPEDFREQLKEVLDEALADIKAAKWPDRETMAAVGKIADSVMEGEHTGVFAWYQVKVHSADFGGQTIDELPVFGMELAGTDRMALMPVGEGADDLFTESFRLVIGEIDPTIEININSTDGGDPKPAKLLRSHFILSDPDS